MKRRWTRQDHDMEMGSNCPLDCVFCKSGEAVVPQPLPSPPQPKTETVADLEAIGVRHMGEVIERCAALTASDQYELVRGAIDELRRASFGGNALVARANNPSLGKELDRLNERRNGILRMLNQRAVLLQEQGIRVAQKAAMPTLIAKAASGAVLSCEETTVLIGEASEARRRVGLGSTPVQLAPVVHLFMLAAASAEFPHSPEIYAAANAANDAGNEPLARALQSIGGRRKHKRLTEAQARAELHGLLRRHASWLAQK